MPDMSKLFSPAVQPSRTASPAPTGDAVACDRCAAAADPRRCAPLGASLATARLADLGKLAARVIHDMRNPLTVIRFALGNLRRAVDLSGSPPAERAANNIEKKVVECEALLASLLAYAKMRRPRRRRFVFRRLVDDCVRDAHARHPAVVFERIRPSGPAPAIVADRQQIKEVVDNLIDNACEAYGSSPGRVRIACRPAGRLIVLTVRDEGAGIDPAIREKLFEPFQSSKPGGTGLGLAICRDIVESHAGRVTLKSRRGHGTTVTVTLPFERGRP